MFFNVGDIVETSNLWQENRGKKGVVKDIKGDIIVVETQEPLLNPDNSVWLKPGFELWLTAGYWKKVQTEFLSCRNLL